MKNLYYYFLLLFVVNVLLIQSTKSLETKETQNYSYSYSAEFPCRNNCSNNGFCNVTTESCVCNPMWGGYDCSIQAVNHYVTSIFPSTVNGGLASIYGYFGNVHQNLSVEIGGLNCLILKVDYYIIQFYAPPGRGIQPLKVSQNNIEYYTLYQYIEQIIYCPNNCLGNGYCNTTSGECDCFENMGGLDCSIYITNTPAPTETPTTPTTPTPQEITCTGENGVLSINSNVFIECKGNGTTHCSTLNSDTVCSTNSNDINVQIYCSTKIGFMSCIGKNIHCESGYLSCHN